MSPIERKGCDSWLNQEEGSQRNATTASTYDPARALSTNELQRRPDRFPLRKPGLGSLDRARRQCGVITRSETRRLPERSASVSAVKRWASEIRSTSIAMASTA